MFSLDLNGTYLSVDGVDYYGSDIMDRTKSLNDDVIQCIIYDKTPHSILTIMGCVLLKKPFLILDKKWPLPYQNQLMHLIQGIDVENDSFLKGLLLLK